MIISDIRHLCAGKSSCTWCLRPSPSLYVYVWGSLCVTPRCGNRCSVCDVSLLPLSPLSWCVGFSTILVCSVFSLFVCHFKIPLCSLLSTLSAFLLAPSQVRILSHPGWVGATAGSRERGRSHDGVSPPQPRAGQPAAWERGARAWGDAAGHLPVGGGPPKDRRAASSRPGLLLLLVCPSMRASRARRHASHTHFSAVFRRSLRVCRCAHRVPVATHRTRTSAPS